MDHNCVHTLKPFEYFDNAEAVLNVLPANYSFKHKSSEVQTLINYHIGFGCHQSKYYDKQGEKQTKNEKRIEIC